MTKRIQNHVKQLLLFIIIGLGTLLVSAASKSFELDQNLESRFRRLDTSFANNFPDKFLVRALLDLSYDTDVDLPGPNTLTWEAGWDLKYWFDAPDGTEAMIVQSTDWSDIKKTVIVFGSTNQLRDWFSNLDYFKESSVFINAPSGVEVHGGFQDALNEVKNVVVTDENMVSQIQQIQLLTFIESNVLDIMGDTNELYVAGHSRGGALSQIMACYLADKYPNINVTMIGFGNPRVGNEQFKNWSESLSNLAVWRYVNDDDVVTRIPPQNFDFHHAGHTFQLWSNDDKATVYYRHIGDGVQYEGAPSYWYFAFSVGDHYVESYMDVFDLEYDNEAYWPTYFAGETTDSSCVDSPLRFKVNVDGRNRFKYCTWVENDNSRCNLDGVPTMCPLTCGQCSTCEDSTLKFKVKLGFRYRTRTCKWVAKRSKRCNKTGVSASCRATCGSC